MNTNHVRGVWLLAAAALFLGSGCGESTPSAPTEASQQKVQAVSKDIVTKYGYPSAKGPQAKPPTARR